MVSSKVDMEKAYDRVEGDFLFKCLGELGFSEKWISWIKECISMVTCSLIVNNVVCGFISPSRGIRQGDPLTPYLFILYMEVLTRKIKGSFS